jgi:hypothetical protein
MGAAPLGETENLFPPLRTECLQGDHVSIVRQFRAAFIRFIALSAVAHTRRTEIRHFAGLFQPLTQAIDTGSSASLVRLAS